MISSCAHIRAEMVDMFGNEQPSWRAEGGEGRILPALCVHLQDLYIPRPGQEGRTAFFFFAHLRGTNDGRPA